MKKHALVFNRLVGAEGPSSASRHHPTPDEVAEFGRTHEIPASRRYPPQPGHIRCLCGAEMVVFNGPIPQNPNQSKNPDGAIRICLRGCSIGYLAAMLVEHVGRQFRRAYRSHFRCFRTPYLIRGDLRRVRWRRVGPLVHWTGDWPFLAWCHPRELGPVAMRFRGLTGASRCRTRRRVAIRWVGDSGPRARGGSR